MAEPPAPAPVAPPPAPAPRPAPRPRLEIPEDEMYEPEGRYNEPPRKPKPSSRFPNVILPGIDDKGRPYYRLNDYLRVPESTIRNMGEEEFDLYYSGIINARAAFQRLRNRGKFNTPANNRKWERFMNRYAMVVDIFDHMLM
jgi:hypothetical protein